MLLLKSTNRVSIGGNFFETFEFTCLVDLGGQRQILVVIFSQRRGNAYFLYYRRTDF
jgi:hypothetical protein